MRVWGWFLVAGGVALVLGCAGGGGGGSQEPASRTACRERLSRLYTATMMYGSDYDDVLPISPWMDAITPYVGQIVSPFRCPAVPEGSYGYAFNSAFLGVPEITIASPDAAPLIFDVDDLAKNVALPYSTDGVTRHKGPLAVYASGRVAPEVPLTLEQQRAVCLSNVKQLATATILYTTDNDDRFPQSQWTDTVEPYLGLDRERIKCPSVPAGGFGYAFGQDLLGASTTTLDFPSAVPLVFDSTVLTRNAATPYTLPRPARHLRNNVAYADGHAASVP